MRGERSGEEWQGLGESIGMGKEGKGGEERREYLRVLLGPLETLGLEPDLICLLKANTLSCVFENFLLPEKTRKKTHLHMKLICKEKY